MIQPRDIIDLLSLRNTSFNKRTGWITCSCPFSENHTGGDKNPSFGINVVGKGFSCFSCSEKGSLVNLITRLLSISTIEAQLWIMKHDDGVDEINSSEREKPRGFEGEYARDVLRWATQDTSYWKSRGLTDATIKKYSLGYSPEKQRAIIPVFEGGQAVGWLGRTVSDPPDPKKWLNSLWFVRNEHLFGLDHALSYGLDSLVVCESPLDAIRLDQLGIPAISTFGCQIGLDQAWQLRTIGVSDVLIAYDPDQAGQRGAEKAIELLGPHLNVSVLPLTSDDITAIPEEELAWALSHTIPHIFWKNPYS